MSTKHPWWLSYPRRLSTGRWEQAPRQFSLFGIDAEFRLDIGDGQENPAFAGLGTPTRIVDLKDGTVRATTKQDMIDHIILIDACKHIHNSQMDIWPEDIPMTTSIPRRSGPGRTPAETIWMVVMAICLPGT